MRLTRSQVKNGAFSAYGLKLKIAKRQGTYQHASHVVTPNFGMALWHCNIPLELYLLTQRKICNLMVCEEEQEQKQLHVPINANYKQKQCIINHYQMICHTDYDHYNKIMVNLFACWWRLLSLLL